MPENEFKRWNNLVSGFNIAMKDLEIRAGDLLGGEQSVLSTK
jgi:transcription-repair coupling factor (superfamily II helicase)